MAQRSLEEVYEALRFQNKQGNTENVQKLSDFIVANAPRKQKEEVGGFAPFFARGVTTIAGAPMDILSKGASFVSGRDIELPGGRAGLEEGIRGIPKDIGDTLGAPVDLITKGLNLIPGVNIKEPILGSEDIRKSLQPFIPVFPGREQKAKTIPEHIGQVTGETTAALLPQAALFKALSGGASLISRIAADFNKLLVRRPVLSLASEETAATVAGTARGLLEEGEVEDPFIRAGVEVAAGLAGGFTPVVAINTPTAFAIRHGVPILKKVLFPFTKAGAQIRAKQGLQGEIGSPLPTVSGRLDEPSITPLPPAVKSGEKRIMGMYKTLLSKDPVKETEAIEQTAKNIVKLEGEMRKLGYGSNDLLIDATEIRVNALEARMNKRILDATNRANTELNKIPKADRQSAEAVIANRELRKEKFHASIETRKAWNDVNMALEVGVKNTRERYLDLRAKVALDQRETTIPTVLKSSRITKFEKFETAEGIVEGPEFDFDDIVFTVLDLQGLRSRLLEIGRTAAKNNQHAKSWFANEMADAVFADLEAIVNVPRGTVQTSAGRHFGAEGLPQKGAKHEKMVELSLSKEISKEVPRIEEPGKVINILNSKTIKGWVGKQEDIYATPEKFEAMKKAVDEEIKRKGLEGADALIFKNTTLRRLAIANKTPEQLKIERKALERHVKEGGTVMGIRTRDVIDVEGKVIEDLKRETITPDIAKLRYALASTKKMRRKFGAGIIGKILGVEQTGVPAIDPTLTLDISAGRQSIKGAVDLKKLIVTPEAKKATERYLGRSFADFATKRDSGEIIPHKASDWIDNNEDILDLFPDLKSKLSNATSAQDFALQTKATMEARKAALRDPKISQAAQLLNINEIQTETDIIMNSKFPAASAAELMRKARNVSGEAVEGVRGGFVEWLLDKSYIGLPNELGEQTLSGSTLLANIKNSEKTLNKVFTPDQIQRMTVIGKELAKIEAFDAVSLSKKDIIELKDLPTTLLRTMSRIVGARIGGKVGKESVGGSLQMAQIASGNFQKLLNWMTRHSAEKMVYDAILSPDKTLLQALLLPIKKPVITGRPANFDILTKRMNTYLISTGKKVMEDIENEERLNRGVN